MRQICMSAIILGLLAANACGSGSNGAIGVKGGNTGSSGSTGSDGGSGIKGGSTGSGGRAGSNDSTGSNGGMGSSDTMGSHGGTGSNGSTESGLAATDACKQSADATCERILRCDGQNGLARLGYISVDDCILHVKANTCSGASDICGANHTYQPDKALSCINALKNLSCNSQTTPAVCDEVCGGSSSPFGGGSLSFGDACKKAAAVYCQKAFACGPDSALSSLAEEYGSQAQCALELEKTCAKDGPCASEQRYHGDKANQCLTEIAALPCTQFDDTPAACDEVCSFAGSGGTSGSTGTSGSGGTSGSAGTSGSSGTAGSGTAYQEFCKQIMTAFCNHCGGELGMTTGSCLSSVQASCTNMKETDSCPTGTFQPSKGQACLDAIGTMNCSSSSPVPGCESEALCNP